MASDSCDSSAVVVPNNKQNKTLETEKKFSTQEIERLIGAWGKEDVLFNCKHPNYFNKDERAVSLRRVIDAVNKEGLTIAELQKKMAGLRTYYSKEFGKEKASMVSGTTTKNIYVSKWPFFTSLSFLRDNITPRKTTSTMVLENEEPNTSKACSPSSDENMNSVFSNNPPASQKSKRKLQMKLEDELLSTCIEELKKPKIEEKPDADASFGKYIVDQLRKVPDGMQKELLKLDIQKLVINAFIPTQESVRRQPFSTINFEDFQ